MRTVRFIAAALVLVSGTLFAISMRDDSYRPTDEERAIAMGLLLDTRADPAMIDEGLRIAEALRRRYAIDSGNVHADRVEAAIRAREEIRAGLQPAPHELSETAERLGFSLDPARCGNTCPNVARLAEIEMQKEALRRLAGATASAGRE